MSGTLTISEYVRMFVFGSTDITPTQKLILTYLINYHPKGRPISLANFAGKIGVKKHLVKSQMIGLLEMKLIRVLTYSGKEGRKFYIEPTFRDATAMGATIVGAL